jgi:hypothetical protein
VGGKKRKLETSRRPDNRCNLPSTNNRNPETINGLVDRKIHWKGCFNRRSRNKRLTCGTMSERLEKTSSFPPPLTSSPLPHYVFQRMVGDDEVVDRFFLSQGLVSKDN